MKQANLLWNRGTGEVFGESVLFTESGEALIAFPAKSIRRIYNPTLGCEYRPGIDFQPGPDGRTVRRTADSAIPFLTGEQLYPPKERAILFPDPNANAIDRSSVSPTGLVCFDPADFFARHQALIDYVTDAPLPELSVPAGKLPNAMARLRNGKSLDLAFIGDSITDGWNATGKVGSAPGQPPWAGLVTEFLNDTFGPCRAFNGAVSGSGSASAVEHLDACCREFIPSLLFIAYGMNDMSRLSQEEFGRNIRAVMKAGLERNPAMEFVLVSQMAGNPEWDLTPAGKDTVYAEELERLAAECQHRAFAPVNRLWRRLTDECGKRFLDLTGNGVNHPNDYGHRLYAAAVTALFR